MISIEAIIFVEIFIFPFAIIFYYQLLKGILKDREKMDKNNIIDSGKDDLILEKKSGDELNMEDNQYFTREEFDEKQWDEIQVGIRSGVEVNKYADKKYHWAQMREIRLGLESGVDVSLYLNRFFYSKDMRIIRMALEKGVDARPIAYLNYNSRQREEIYLGLLSGIDISCYANEKYNEWKMMEMRLGLEQGIDLSRYLETHNHNQMHQIRLGYEENLEVYLYDDARYKQSHMKELRIALLNGFDVTNILDPALSIDEVRRRKKNFE